MGRRKPHLFELLGRRTDEPAPSRRTRNDGSARDRDDGRDTQHSVVSDVGQRLRSFADAVFARASAGKRSPTAKARKPVARAEEPGRRWNLGSPTLAGVVCGALLVGFGLGSWFTKPASAASEDLRMAGASSNGASEGATPRGPAPRTFPDDASGGNAAGDPASGAPITVPEKFLRKHSKSCYSLLQFSPAQIGSAVQVAEFVASEGVDHVRIVRAQTKLAEEVLLVVVHAPDGDDTHGVAGRRALVDRLKKLDTRNLASRSVAFSTIAARLDDSLAKLRPEAVLTVSN